MGKVEASIISLMFSQRAPLTIRQISEKLKKAYPHVHTVTTQLIDEGVLTKNVVGNAYSCSLNITNEKAKALIVIAEYNYASSEKKKSHIPRQVLTDAEILKQSGKISSIVWDYTSLIVIAEDQSVIAKLIANSDLKAPCIAATPSSVKKALYQDHVILHGAMNLLQYASEVKP